MLREFEATVLGLTSRVADLEAGRVAMGPLAAADLRRRLGDERQRVAAQEKVVAFDETAATDAEHARDMADLEVHKVRARRSRRPFAVRGERGECVCGPGGLLAALL